MKIIPIPSKENYLKIMITKLESFVKRLRWKAFFMVNQKQRMTKLMRTEERIGSSLLYRYPRI